MVPNFECAHPVGSSGTSRCRSMGLRKDRVRRRACFLLASPSRLVPVPSFHMRCASVPFRFRVAPWSSAFLPCLCSLPSATSHLRLFFGWYCSSDHFLQVQDAAAFSSKILMAQTKPVSWSFSSEFGGIGSLDLNHQRYTVNIETNNELAPPIRYKMNCFYEDRRS